MEDKELWTTFEKTGRIVDYLNYKHLYEGEYKDYFTKDKEQEAGEKQGESDSHSDRDGAVRDTYR